MEDSWQGADLPCRSARRDVILGFEAGARGTCIRSDADFVKALRVDVAAKLEEE